MAYKNNQPEFPNSSDERKSARHLPKYFRTEKNRKFLQATLDQMLQPGVAEKINSFVGRKTAKGYSSSNNYLAEISKDRKDYQLEPASFVKDDLGNIKYYKEYRDYINGIQNFYGITDNHSRINKQETYAWDPHIDWDKFINFREYYWLPTGPQTVTIPGESKEITSTYTVSLQSAGGDLSYIFTPDGLTPNPVLKLYRGVKYRFEINAEGVPLSFRTKRTLDNEFLIENGISEQNVENGVIEFEVGSEIPDEIFYVAENDINIGGIIKVANIEESTVIDVDAEISGKKFYTTRDGWDLTNGLKIRFSGEVTPAKYVDTEWYVEGVGKEIILVSDRDVEVSFPVGIDKTISFDEEGFDRNPFGSATGYPRDKDYITINRASTDGNFWSRYNRWFHKDVIELSEQINKNGDEVDQTARANRPIIEFEPGLKLYNFGTRSKEVVDLIDNFTTDVFSTIEGSLGYNIDGVDLSPGMRILFLADNDPLVKGKIFEVGFINFKGSGVDGQITLQETADTNPEAGENVLVVDGAELAGQLWYYDGTNWNEAQKKTSVNQVPYFDVFNENDVSYSDSFEYPASSFRGNSIFSYAVGTGSNDSALGFPLKYRSIQNVGDIVFDFDFNSADFSYQIDGIENNKKIKDGFLRRYNKDNTYELIDVYTKTDELSFQSVVQVYTFDNSSTNFKIDCYNRSAELSDLKVTVYKNGILQYLNKDYKVITTTNQIAAVEFIKNIEIGDAITIKTKTSAKKLPEIGYYEIPDNLERNPLNEDIVTFTLGEVQDHLETIVENLTEFDGIYPGPSNLRDISDKSAKGKKFVKHSMPLNLVMHSILENDNNLIKSLRYAKKEYSKFKRRFLETAESLGFEGSVRKHVDEILVSINKDKNNQMPFYFSDMLPYGTSLTTSITIEDEDANFYALNNDFNLDNLSTQAVTVYLNGIQLLHGNDYVFENGFINITKEKSFGDVIEINQFDNTNGSYIPPTPTKLGLYPLYVPEKYTDTTYGNPVSLIIGHDGSIVRAYDDYRDNLILEFEKRIFNNIKIKYDPNLLCIQDYVPGAFRNTQFSLTDVNTPMTTDFIQWLSFVDQDYTTNDFYQAENGFTFNYGYLNDLNGDALPGWWREVYKWYYDTDRPHTNPWEMLGFTIKPTWWEDQYGPAPYTRNNYLLWEDLQNGIVREPNKPFYITQKFKRPGLLDRIPVDASGNLLAPNDCNLVRKFSSNKIKSSFKFGDGAPVEAAWRNSSEYPFALLTSWAINNGSALLSVGFDRSRQIRNSVGHLIYKESNTHIKLEDLVFPNTVNDDVEVLSSGLVNYIVNYMSSSISFNFTDYVETLKSIKNSLSFKVGGFTDKSKFKLVLDSRTPLNEGNVFVPEENYNIFLNTSSPIARLSYSGVIVELSPSGFVIRGYDKENPVFRYTPPFSSDLDNYVNVGGVSEPFVNWEAEKTYSAGTVIQVENKYYRAKVTFTTSQTLDFTNLAELTDGLPITGGVDAAFKQKFSQTESILPYGTTLRTVQEVVDFLLGYENYLKLLGFKFEYFDGDEKSIYDWTYSAREFMFWTLQGWQAGTIISLSPAAKNLNYEKEFTTIDNTFDNFFGYSLVKSDGAKLSPENVKINRLEKNTYSIESLVEADGLYAINLPVVQKEHVVLIDNESIFGDVIYQPSTGYRQERIKILGYKSTNWDGSLNIPGFVYYDPKITNWTQWEKYFIGDIVKFKEFYYIATTNLQGAESFDYTQWQKLDETPTPQLLTNFEYKTNQFADFYDLDTDNFDVEQQQLAQHLIGYQKRKYLENIINDEVSQYKFYQGMIQEKGTRNSLDKLFDVLSSNDKESLDFYEEWAIKQGQYGANEGFEELEFKLDERKVLVDPQPIKLTNEDSDGTSVVYTIKDYELYRKPLDYKNNPFPALRNSNQYTRTSGYVNLEDVDYAVAEYNDILNLNINDLKNDQYIWVGKKDRDWDVYRVDDAPYKLTSIKTVTQDLDIQEELAIIQLTVNGPAKNIVQVGDIIGLNYITTGAFNEDSTYPIFDTETAIDVDGNPINGLFKVIKFDTNRIFVSTTKSIEQLDKCEGIIIKFNSVRVESFEEANDVAQLETFKNSLVWVDNKNNWKVIKNDQPYNLLQNIPNTEVEESTLPTYGASLATDNSNTVLSIANPTAGNDGRAFVYTRGSSEQNLTYSQLLEPSRAIAADNQEFGTGQAITRDGKYLLIGAPNASQVKSRYLGNYDQTRNYQNGDIVQYQDQLWEVIVDIQGARTETPFSSFVSLIESLQDFNVYNNEFSYSNMILGNYPITDITVDHILIRAGKDQYEATSPLDTVYFDWYATSTVNQQTVLAPRAPFDNNYPVVSEQWLESGLPIVKKVDVVMYVDDSFNLPDVGIQVETETAFGYLNHVFFDNGRLVLYIENTSGTWENSGSLYYETGEYVGEYVIVGPSLSEPPGDDNFGGYWYFDLPETVTIPDLQISNAVDEGRALAVYNVIPNGKSDFGGRGGNIFDLNNNEALTYGSNSINSWYQTLTYIGTPGPGNDTTIQKSDLWVLRSPKDLYDVVTPGEDINVEFLRFPYGPNSDYTDVTLAGLEYVDLNKAHTLYAKWAGWIKFELSNLDTARGGRPFEPKIGQTVRERNGNNATAQIEFYQKLNNETAVIFVSNVNGEWGLRGNEGRQIEWLGNPNDPDPVYRDNLTMGPINDIALEAEELGIGGLLVFQAEEEIRIVDGIDELVPEQSIFQGVEYLVYRDTTILGRPTEPNIPASNNFDYKQVFKIPVDGDGIDGEFNEFGYFSIYERENIGQYTQTASFLVPSDIDELRSGWKIKTSKNGDFYKAFIGCEGKGTYENTGRIYFFNKGTDESGISYDWELSRDKRYKGEFDTNTDYFVNDIVFYQGNFYKALTNISGDGTGFIALEWEIATSDSVRSLDYLGYIPNNTNNVPEDYNYKGEFTPEQSYIVENIVKWPDNTYYRALRFIPLGYTGFQSVNGVLTYPEEDWEQIEFTPGGDQSLKLDTTGLLRFGKDFDVSDNGEVLVTTAEFDDNTIRVIIYRNVNGHYQKSQELIGFDGYLEEIVNDNGVVVRCVRSANSDFGISVSISQDGKLIAVGAPNEDTDFGEERGAVYVYKQVNGTFSLHQCLKSANPERGEQYGAKIDFDGKVLYVSAFNAKSDDETLIDSGTTTFDSDFTSFKNNVINTGVTYVYDNIEDNMVYAQMIDYHVYLERDGDAIPNYFGRNIYSRNNHLYVSLPKYSNKEGKNGLILDYSRQKNRKPYIIHRELTNTVDLEKIKQIMLYSIKDNAKLIDLDYIDPAQGKIAGIADQEIDYKTSYDPAMYNQGTTVNKTNYWSVDNVGRIWWDLSNAKFLNVYQGNTIYKNNNFNTLAPGGEINVYEWVETTYSPEQWDNLSGTNAGDIAGVTGKTKYGNTSYSTAKKYDKVAQKFNTYYYFWVENKTTTAENKNLSVSSIKSLIEDPAAQGYRFVALYDESSFGIFNCNRFIQGEDTVLNIQYWTSGNKNSNIHNQYQIITQGMETSMPSEDLQRKWFDSLIGFDEKDRPVPDLRLSEKDRYGIFNNPRQSMFKNRVEALKQFVERTNRVLKENAIVNSKSLTNLSKIDNPPLETSNKYDINVETRIDLNFVGVVRARLATASPVVENGKIVRIDITDSGRGYKRPPTFEIQGQGRDAAFRVEINEAGEVTDIVVLNEGLNYNDDTTITFRPFTVLVDSDETIAGRWATYVKQGQDWQRISSQAFDVPQYWDYTDWYDTGYNRFTEIDQIVNFNYNLQSLENSIGDIVKVNDSGDGTWALLEKIDSQITTDYTVNYKTIGQQRGTIQLSSALYDLENNRLGFDNQTFDTAYFDIQPVAELRIILNSIKDDIFVNDLLEEYNNLFFASIRYLLSEQTYVDWLFKTSFVRAIHNVGELKQIPTFKNDNLPSYEDYINEVKPYKTTVREYISKYEKIENSSTSISDFDSPPRYDIDLNSIVVNDSTVIGNSLSSSIVSRYATTLDKDWLENYTYSVTEIRISEAGSGYLFAPIINIEGDAEAVCSLGPNGQISSVVVTNAGSGYVSNPTITINGTQREDGTPARLNAVLGNNPIRNIHTTVKFDRVSGSYYITVLNVTETFTASGSKIEYDLKWPMDLRTDTIEVLVDGELILNSNYEVENHTHTETSLQGTKYTRTYGHLQFNDPPAEGVDVVINYKKAVEFLAAADRINYYYDPTAGQFGKNLSQLMDGVDYGGVEVTGYGFESRTGWDNDNWYEGAWDVFDTGFDDESLTASASQTTFNLSQPLQDKTKYNIYVNNIRIDDEQWDGSSADIDNKNAIMSTILGDGVTDTVTIEDVTLYEIFKANNNIDPNGNIIFTIRKNTSDGSIELAEQSYDTIVTGGDLAYSTAKGINADEITIDGDLFVTPTTSKGPEEVIPGQILDTLDIQVYERSASGNAIIESIAYVADGTTAEFNLRNKPFTNENVIVTIDGSINRDSNLYRIDYENSKIVFYSEPANGTKIVVTTFNLGAEDILDYGEIRTSNNLQSIKTSVNYDIDNTAFVTIDGIETEYALEEDIDGLTLIRFATPLVDNKFVQYAIFNSTEISYSKVTVDEITATGTDSSYELSLAPFTQQPSSYFTLVTVNDTVLKAGYSKIFTFEDTLDFQLPLWQVPVGSTQATDLQVYVNDRKLEYLQEWLYTGSGAFNPKLPADQQEGSVVTILPGIANPGDEIRIYIINSGQYRFGYFDDDNVFVDTSGRLVPASLLPVIEDGVIVAIDIQEGGYGYENETAINVSGIGINAEIYAITNEFGVITDANIVNGGSGYDLETELVVQQPVLTPIIHFDEVYSEGTSIKVYQFSNHDPLGIERYYFKVLEQTDMSDFTQGYYDFRQLKNKKVSLDTAAISADYIFISLNGKLLVPGNDFILKEDKLTIEFIVNVSEYDEIEIINFAANTITPKFGWRQFKDMLNRNTYYRLSKDRQFTLANDLNWYDRTIEVTDATNLPAPMKKYPGVLFINGERIEYFAKEDNTLKNLRRGTGGTGTPQVHAAGTKFYSQNFENVIPYKDNEVAFKAIAGKYVDLSLTYENSPEITFESISYDFNNNTVFPLGTQTATVKGTGFREAVVIVMQDEDGNEQQLETTFISDTELTFKTVAMPVGAYDLVILNQEEDTPIFRAATSLVVKKALPYVQVLIPFEPEAFTDVVQSPTETGEWYKRPFEDGGIPEEYWEALDIEVFSNGKRLRKSPIVVYNPNLGQNSPDADEPLEAEYAVNKNEGAYVRLTVPPEPETILTIVRRQGEIWNELGKSLAKSNTKVATFLRGKTIELPR